VKKLVFDETAGKFVLQGAKEIPSVVEFEDIPPPEQEKQSRKNKSSKSRRNLKEFEETEESEKTLYVKFQVCYKKVF
jgi:hypothetical protein